MSYLILTMGVFALATAINTASIALQQKCGLPSRLFRKGDWFAHLALVTPAWVWCLVLLRRLGQHVRWPLPEMLHLLGLPVLGAGVILFLFAFRELGFAAAANGYFFGRTPKTPVRSGVFRVLKNPIYDSYAIGLAGVALLSANAVYLLVAAESVLLLNQVEARVENQPFERDGLRA